MLSSDSGRGEDDGDHAEEDDEEEGGEEGGQETESFFEASITPSHLQDAISFAISEIQTWASLWCGGGGKGTGKSPRGKKGIAFLGVLTQGIDDAELLSILAKSKF